MPGIVEVACLSPLQAIWYGLFRRGGCLESGPQTLSQDGKGTSMARARLKELQINREWCKGCGICVAFCPKEVLEMDPEGKAVVVRADDCIVCDACALRCPDLAVTVVKDETEPD